MMDERLLYEPLNLNSVSWTLLVLKRILAVAECLLIFGPGGGVQVWQTSARRCQASQGHFWAFCRGSIWG